MGTGEKLMQGMQVKGKTEQRVDAVVFYLMGSEWVSYEDISKNVDASYDSLLYILATLECLGRVQKEAQASGPGRPKVFFKWAV